MPVSSCWIYCLSVFSVILLQSGALAESGTTEFSTNVGPPTDKEIEEGKEWLGRTGAIADQLPRIGSALRVTAKLKELLPKLGAPEEKHAGVFKEWFALAQGLYEPTSNQPKLRDRPEKYFPPLQPGQVAPPAYFYRFNAGKVQAYVAKTLQLYAALASLKGTATAEDRKELGEIIDSVMQWHVQWLDSLIAEHGILIQATRGYQRQNSRSSAAIAHATSRGLPHVANTNNVVTAIEHPGCLIVSEGSSFGAPAPGEK